MLPCSLAAFLSNPLHFFTVVSPRQRGNCTASQTAKFSVRSTYEQHHNCTFGALFYHNCLRPNWDSKEVLLSFLKCTLDWPVCQAYTAKCYIAFLTGSDSHHNCLESFTVIGGILHLFELSIQREQAVWINCQVRVCCKHVQSVDLSCDAGHGPGPCSRWLCRNRLWLCFILLVFETSLCNALMPSRWTQCYLCQFNHFFTKPS